MIDHDNSVIERQLAALSPKRVERLVGQTLGGVGWHNPRWRVDRLHASTGAATGGTYRLAGSAMYFIQPYGWSAILKVIRPLAGLTPEQNAVQSHPIYWKREVLAYQSGWLDHLPGGLRVPRLLAIEPQPDGSVWLWLEDVHDAYRSQWPLAQYAHAARCLGRFNGAYVAGRPWPPYVWLSRTTTEPRGVIDAFGWAEALVRDPATWQHPLLRDIFAADLVARLPEFWSSRHRLLEAYERLPQTLCHQDAWRGNWIVPDIALDADMVLVDWAVAGRGVLGSDLGDLAVAEHGTLLDSISLADIDDTVFDAYLAGLREAGWPAERNQVRFAYTTFAALKYGCLLIWLRNVLDETLRADLERVLGRPIDGYLRQQAVLLEHLLRLHAEALSLLETR